MARRTHDLLYNVTGQKIAHRVLSGRPTAAGSFKVFRDTQADDSTDPEFTGNLSLDSPNTTVDAASGPAQDDPRKLNLASTSGIQLGRKYLLTKNSLSEWVQPIEIVTDDYIICRYPLQRDYESGDAFESTYLELTVDATWIQDEDHLSNVLDPDPDYRARLEFTNVDGDTEVRYEFFDVVRALIDHQVVLTDIAARWPTLIRDLDMDMRGDRGQDIIDAAWRSLVADLHALDLNDQAIRDLEGIDEAMILKCRVFFAAAGKSPPNWSPDLYYELTKTEFDDFFRANYKDRVARRFSSGGDGQAVSKADVGITYWSK